MQLSNPLILHSSSFTPRFPCTHNPTRISAHVSARPAKREPAAPSDPKTEAQELVRHLLRSFSGKEPIVRTLHRHVRDIRTHHCFLLFEELGRTDKWLQCLEVFRWMQKQRWYVADNGIYSKLISVMGKRGQTRMAMWLFSEMRTSGCKPDTSVYNALITAHLHSTDKTKALTKALVYYEKLKGMPRCQPNVVTYNILLRASAQARNVVQVKALFDDLGKSGMDPDVYTFNGVMDAYGKNGMISEMESVLARMKDTDCKPDIVTFNLLIDSYGKKQEFAKMEQVFRSLMRSKEKPTLPTFNSMILSYGKARLKEKAESVYEKLRDMNYTPSFVTYESLITMYGICDCVSKARDIFDDLAMSGKEVRVSTMNVMLDAYCKNGLHVEAHALLENARSMHVMPDTATYKLLFRAYTKADMKMLMGKLLKNMDRDGIVPSKSFFLETRGVDSRSPKASSSRKPRTSSSGQKEEART